MTVDTLIPLIANVEMMAGNPLSELLAPGEIVAIAQPVAAAGLIMEDGTQYLQSQLAPHMAWMGSVPASMYDCFNG